MNKKTVTVDYVYFDERPADDVLAEINSNMTSIPPHLRSTARLEVTHDWENYREGVRIYYEEPLTPLPSPPPFVPVTQYAEFARLNSGNYVAINGPGIDIQGQQ